MSFDARTLEADLRITQRKLNLLCGWIRFKFGDDPTLPQALFSNTEVQSDDEFCLKSELHEDPTTPEIRLVNLEHLIDQSDEGLRTNEESEPILCEICDKTFPSSITLTIHKTEHCFVQVERLSSSIPSRRVSRRKDNLIVRNVEEYQENYIEFAIDSPQSDPEDTEYIPEDQSENEVEIVEFLQEGIMQGEIEKTLMREEGRTKQDARLVCSYCTKTFPNRNSLLIHKYKIHRQLKLAKSSRLYFCHICDKSFGGLLLRRKHILDVHYEELNMKHNIIDSEAFSKIRRVERSIVCPLCAKVLPNRARARKHIQSIHPLEATNEIMTSLEDPIPFCKECKMSFKHRTHLLAHYRLHHPQSYLEKRATGEIITKNRRRRTELEKNRKRTRARMYQFGFGCPLCEIRTKTRRQIRIHLESLHSDEVTPQLLDSLRQVIPCEICGKTYEMRNYYVTHLRRRHPEKYKEKKLRGEIAERTGRPRKSKDKALVSSADITSYIKCPFCETQFKTNRKLQNHLKSSHASDTTVEIIAKFKDPTYCVICNKDCTYHSTYIVHMRDVHPHEYTAMKENGEIKEKIRKRTESYMKPDIEVESVGNRRQLTKCEECGDMVQIRWLPSHKKTKHRNGVPRPYVCTQCPFSTVRKSGLADHMHIHSDVRKYKCGLCSFSAKQSGGLKAHMRAKHCQDSQIQCTLCGVLVKTTASLKRHLADIHMNSRRFPCHLCEKAFKVKTHLNYHVKTHSNPHGRKRGLNRERMPLQRAPNKTSVKQTLNFMPQQFLDDTCQSENI